MSDKNNESWRDIFGEENEYNTDIPEEEKHPMTDEELDAYLRSLDAPGEPGSGSTFSDTMVSDWLPTVEELDKDKTGSESEPNDATSVIPNDVKKISEITRKTPKLRGAAERGGIEEEEEEGWEEDNEYRGRDYQPVRRRRNHRTGCMGGIMFFAFVLGISIILACFAWLFTNDVLSLTKEYISATIEVPENYDMDAIIDELKEKGIIEYKFLFRIFANISDAENKIDPGTYELSTELDYRAIVAKMQEGSDSSLTVRVTIPEGRTMEQIFELLEREEVCDREKLWEAAENYDFKYPFLDASTIGDRLRLEGFLFPDTYEFYVNSNPNGVIERFLDNFENKVTSEMYRKAELMEMSMKEIITIASLIEMEAANNDERATVSSVIYNRIYDDEFPFLQIDASIQYILEERKEELTNADLMIDNPYNTYFYPGLPPGPIANPGLASIEAALEPEETTYYFYALHKDGYHEFFETYEEHVEFTDSENFVGYEGD